MDRNRLASTIGIPLLRSTRVPLEWEVEGDAGWLRWWPDDVSQSPVDEIFAAPSIDNELDRAEWNRLVELESNLFRLQDSTIRSFIEIPVELDSAIDPSTLLRDAVTARDALLRGYVRAIETTAERCRRDVEAVVTEAVGAHRAELAWYGAVDDSLALIPEILEIHERPTSSAAHEEHPEKRLEVLPELSEGSFDAIVEQILRWRDRVEMYPNSFGALQEDACSDVLAATLAMLFRVAEREVFVYGGKSDIYIPLAALHPDRPDARETFYFYAEAKKGSGPALAEHALGQLEKYRALRVRRAVVLFYVTAQDLVAAADRTLTAFADWAPVSSGSVERLLHRFEVSRDGLGRLELTVIFPIWSLTKIMTATMVLILADRDLLDLRGTIASAIPGVRIAGDAADRITIRQLLSHTAGIPPMGPPPTGIADTGPGDDCRELLVNSLASARLVAQPGEVYSYSNPGYVVLAYLIERLTKTTWEAALCDLLLDPAGIEEVEVPYHRPLDDAAKVAVYQRDEAGQLVRVEEIYPAWRSGAPCGLTLWGTARALVSLGRIFFNGVAPNGRRILSEAALAAMGEPESAARSALASGGSFQGLGWRGFDMRGHRILEHGGGRHNTLSVVPSRNLAVAVMTNGPGGDGLHEELAGHLIDVAVGTG